VQVVTALVHDAAEIETAMTMLGREPGGGLILETAVSDVLPTENHAFSMA
jgi:hypothetical protein